MPSDVLSRFAAVEHVTVGEGITELPVNAFYNRCTLKSVALPSTVKKIPSGAFMDCTALTDVTLGGGASIDYMAFNNCTSLKHIDIPATVTKIDRSAFSNCRALENIEIPDSVTSIGYGAFSGCRALTSVKLPADLEEIGEYVFSDCDVLNDIEFPVTLQSIGSYAFRSCTSLVSMVIPDNVTSLGSETFSFCTSLEEITLGSGITRARYCLKGCTSITSVTVPAAFTVTDTLAEFFGCTSANFFPQSLESVAFTSGTTIDTCLLERCESLTHVTLPDTLVEIKSRAFYCCSGLTEIVVPNGVTTIGLNAFDGCTSLKSAYIPLSVVNVSSSVINTPCTFVYCEIERAKLPASWSIFWCTSRAFIIWDCLNSTVDQNGYDVVYVDGLIYGLKDGEATLYHDQETTDAHVTVPESITVDGTVYPVTSVYKEAFYTKMLLQTITLPNSIREIGDYAFSLCMGLKHFVIPHGVTTLGQDMLSRCTELRSVTIPDTVTSLPSYMLYMCTALTEINYGGTMEQWNNVLIGPYWRESEANGVTLKTADGQTAIV